MEAQSTSTDYFFVSHASADNERLKPAIVAILERGVNLWFDRPYDIGLRTSCFAGYIREGEPWTTEILQAVVGACGILCFPSEATSRSDECRLELALGRVLGAVCSFKIFPLLLDDGSFRFLDHRVVQTQGRKIYVAQEDGVFTIPLDAHPSIAEFADVLTVHAKSFAVGGTVLQSLFEKFTATQHALTAPRPVAQPLKFAGPVEFGKIVERYRSAVDGRSRRAVDEHVATHPRSFSLDEILPNVLSGPDEPTALAAAMSLACGSAADSQSAALTVARELLRLTSERVRLRVADALLRRAQARLVTPAQRIDILCLLEASIAFEQHAEVLLVMQRARDALAAA